MKRLYFYTLILLGVCSTVSAQEPKIEGLDRGTGSQLTVEEARQAVLLHDLARSKVGIKTRLKWSTEIAKLSQEWANQLVKSGEFKHSNYAGLGENIARNSSIKEAVAAWESEKAQYKDGQAIDRENYVVFGHYTQMVWEKTTTIGMGKAKRGEQWIIVCNYNPPGNFIGEKPVYSGKAEVVVEVPAKNPKPAAVPLLEGKLTEQSQKMNGLAYTKYTQTFESEKQYKIEVTSQASLMVLIFDSKGEFIGPKGQSVSTTLTIPKNASGEYQIFVAGTKPGILGTYQLKIEPQR